MVVKSVVQGLYNQNRNYECQDYASTYEDEQKKIIVLADGAGSKEFSRIGAMSVVQSCEEYLKEQFYGDFEGLLTYITHELKNQDYAWNQLASTLMFTYYTDGKVYFGNIGDGIIIKVKDGESTVISQAENGEYVNETFFVTDYDVNKHYRTGIDIDKGRRAYILLSDGIAKSIYDRSNGNISNVCVQFMEWCCNNSKEEVEAALNRNIEEYIKTKTRDDLGIAIMLVED